jgi:hypothetical protein
LIDLGRGVAQAPGLAGLTPEPALLLDTIVAKNVARSIIYIVIVLSVDFDEIYNLPTNLIKFRPRFFYVYCIRSIVTRGHAPLDASCVTIKANYIDNEGLLKYML